VSPADDLPQRFVASTGPLPGPLQEVLTALGRHCFCGCPASRRLLCVPALECLPHYHKALVVRPNERPVRRDDAWTDVARPGAYGFEHAAIDALRGGFVHRSAWKRSRTARSISGVTDPHRLPNSEVGRGNRARRKARTRLAFGSPSARARSSGVRPSSPPDPDGADACRGRSILALPTDRLLNGRRRVVSSPRTGVAGRLARLSGGSRRSSTTLSNASSPRRSG